MHLNNFKYLIHEITQGQNEMVGAENQISLSSHYRWYLLQASLFILTGVDIQDQETIPLQKALAPISWITQMVRNKVKGSEYVDSFHE